MRSKNSKIRLHIRIYRSKKDKNINLVIIQNKSNKKEIIKTISRNKTTIYLRKLIHTENIQKVKIIKIVNRKIQINKGLHNTGWLYFPKHKYAVGVVFFGDKGIVASPYIPSVHAWFIPLDSPIIYLLDVDIADFY